MMQENLNTYTYAGLLVHNSKKSFFDPVRNRQPFIPPPQRTLNDQALEKAAKKICNLQCGRCPIKEEDFAGCSVDCDEEVRPWRCWVTHFKTGVNRGEKTAS